MQKKKLKLIAFDFDGVIVDSLNHNIEITNKTCLEHGCLKGISIADLQEIDEMSFNAVAVIMGLPQDKFKPCLEEINRQLVATYEGLQPFPGICNVIKRLDISGISSIIVTHNTEYAVNSFLKKHDIFSNFKLVYGAETEGEKAEKLAKALKELSIQPDEVVMIGDSVGDIQSSIAAGVVPLGVEWGFQNAEKLSRAGAVKILKKPEDIAKLADFCG